MAVLEITAVLIAFLVLISFGYHKREKLWWEKSWWDKIIIPLIVPLTIGVVTSVWGFSFSSALKDKELRVKYVEIAVGILREKPSKECEELRN